MPTRIAPVANVSSLEANGRLPTQPVRSALRRRNPLTFCSDPDPLKCYVPYNLNANGDGSAENREIRFGPSNGTEQPALFELCGYKEGRFMKRWESRIKHAVMRGAGTDGQGHARGQPESLGDALVVEREEAQNRQVIRALDGYDSA